MLDQAAQAAGDAAGPHIGQLSADGVLNHVEPGQGDALRRRITADSFRALSARLKGKTFAPPTPEPLPVAIPDIISEVRQAAAAPLPAAEWAVEPPPRQVERFVPEPVWELEAPRRAEPSLEEIAAPEAEARETFLAPSARVYAEFEPPAGFDEPVAPTFDSIEAAAPSAFAEPAAPVFEAVEAAAPAEFAEPAAPVFEAIENVAPAGFTESDAAAAGVFEVAAPAALPEKLTLAELTRLVYSTPDENDRALYLRELAEILAEETARAEEALSRSPHAYEAPAEAVFESLAAPAPAPEEIAEAASAATWGSTTAVFEDPTAPEPAPVQFDAAPEHGFVEPELPPPPIEEGAPDETVCIPEEPAFVEEAAAQPVFDAEPAASAEPVAPPADISAVLSERFGGNAQLLRKAEEADPFAAQPQLPPAAPTPQEEMLAEEAEDVARSLLDMMSSTGGSGLPQERALAADTLLRMIPRMPLKAVVSVVERIAMMSQPPELLVARLIRDPRFEVAGPLLERCNAISDQDIAAVIQEGDFAKQRMIARRRVLSSPLSDKLIAFDDTSVLLTLVRNAGASISHEAYYRLAEHAAEHASLLAPLSTRQDLPAPVAFELFWSVPPELRRYLLSRFLTDSETLNKILKITISMQGGDEQGEAKFPERVRVDAVVEHATAGKLEEAAVSLAEIAGICAENAYRILADRDGEALAIVMKALGVGRARFGEIVSAMKRSGASTLSPARENAELQSIFDSMSFNKARILLTYWDWAVQKSGPYAASH
jgi:hypothetical protein